MHGSIWNLIFFAYNWVKNAENKIVANILINFQSCDARMFTVSVIFLTLRRKSVQKTVSGEPAMYPPAVVALFILGIYACFLIISHCYHHELILVASIWEAILKINIIYKIRATKKYGMIHFYGTNKYRAASFITKKKFTIYDWRMCKYQIFAKKIRKEINQSQTEDVNRSKTKFW